MSATLPPLERFVDEDGRERVPLYASPIAPIPARPGPDEKVETWLLLRSRRTGKVVRMVRVG